MKYRTVAALAAIASKYNAAGKSAEEAQSIAEELLEYLDDNPDSWSVSTGGLTALRHEDSVELLLPLGDLRSLYGTDSIK